MFKLIAAALFAALFLSSCGLPELIGNSFDLPNRTIQSAVRSLGI